MGLKILYALKSIDGAPEEFQLFPYGQIDIDGEPPAFLDDESMNVIIADFKRRANDMVIDYEHQTLAGTQAPAAGWVKKFINRGKEGLWVTVEWTKQAKEYLENREYRYFSPVFWVADKGRKILKVENVALTNYPGINNLKPIMAKMSLDEKAARESRSKKYNIGKYRKEAKMLSKLKKLFGLADDATEDKVVETVEAVVAKNKTLEKQIDEKSKKVVAKEVIEALDLKETDGVSTVVASIHALKQSGKGTVSREEFDKIQNDLRKRDADEIVAKALDTGKITPDQKDWATEYAERDLDGFKVFVSKATVVVPLDKLKKKQTRTDDAIADEAVLNVAKMFGNTPEDIKKYG